MVDFSSVASLLNTYGDAVISQSGDDVYCCFPLDEFHTCRFETSDGVHFYWSLDGTVFLAGVGFQWNGYSSVFFMANGGCIGDKMKDLENAWDFIRYGTLSEGEIIVSADPPQGFLDAREHVGLDRILITFDQPAYAYIDDITVGSDVPPAPQVIATRRRDNGEPDELEIVLDRPIPLHATTQLLIDTGAPRHRTVTFTFAPGDTDGDGDADLADYSWLQNCAGVPLNEGNRLTDSSPISFAILDSPFPIPPGPCLALDSDENASIDPLDYADFALVLSGPMP